MVDNSSKPSLYASNPITSFFEKAMDARPHAQIYQPKSEAPIQNAQMSSNPEFDLMEKEFNSIKISPQQNMPYQPPPFLQLQMQNKPPPMFIYTPSPNYVQPTQSQEIKPESNKMVVDSANDIISIMEKSSNPKYRDSKFLKFMKKVRFGAYSIGETQLIKDREKLQKVKENPNIMNVQNEEEIKEDVPNDEFNMLYIIH
jgi:hypothetical protein